MVGENGSLAFVFSGGICSSLLNVNATTTSEFAFGVNDKETIVGGYADSNTGTTSGLVYRSGAFTTLNPVVNALVTNAQGINNNGLVTGFYSTDGTLSRVPVQHPDRQLHINCRSQRPKLRVLATARHQR